MSDKIKTWKSEVGSIFTALLGGVALVGVLGVTAYNTLSGPVATMSRVTNKTITDNQLMAVSKIAIMDAANQTNGGDCDGDGLIEPAEWRDGGTPPTGGGLVPDTLGAPLTDPWGSEFGYCVWDVGTTTADAACDIDGDAETDDRLDGADDPTTGDENLRTVMAVISSGPDRIFQTECKSHADAVSDTTGVLVEGGDDIVMSYSYIEAGTATSSLWNIKTGDADTAEIGKNVEIKDGGGTVQARIDQTGTGELLAVKTDNLYSKTGPGTAVAVKDGIKLENTVTAGAACAVKGMLAVKDDGSGDIVGCGSSNTWEGLGGGPTKEFDDDNSVDCDGTTLGQVRFNTTDEIPEFCDGANWRAFTLGADNVNLTIDPISSQGMDLSGPCSADCPDVYGAEVIFTVQNIGTVASNPIAYTITGDVDHFEDQVTSDCAGASLDPNDSCEIRIKPVSDANGAYVGRLSITTDNQPFVNMSGEADSFGCYVGASGPGGYYVGCNISGTYDLVIMPGGCDGTTTNPTCSGTDGASIERTWADNGVFEGANDIHDGPQNSANMYQLQTAGAANFPAISYCMEMEYGGYDDWYLPSLGEWDNYIYHAVGKLGDFFSGTDDKYWLSGSVSEHPSYYDNARAIDISSGSNTYYLRTQSYHARCVRRDGQAMPAAQIDDTPHFFGFITAATEAVWETTPIESNTVTILGVNTTLDVSMTETAGNSGFKINGGAKETADTTVTVGDTITLVMDIPSTYGDSNQMKIRIGDQEYSWTVGASDPSIVKRIFISNRSVGVNMDEGGIGALDTKCQLEAEDAGLGGTWRVLISGWNDAANFAANRVSWNWGELQNTNGDKIADDWNDLWDGSIDNPILYDENREIISGNRVMSATGPDGGLSDTTNDDNDTCLNWDSASSATSYRPRLGDSTATSDDWISANNSYSCQASPTGFYCMEYDEGTPDETPKAFEFSPMTTVTTASTREESEPITIERLGPDGAEVSLDGSDGTPRFKINGGAEDAGPTTIYNGDTLKIVMTSPAGVGDRHSVRVQVGTYETLWFLGSSSMAGTKRVFVTSTRGDGDWGGPGGPDATCQAAADAVPLGGTWTAIISNNGDPLSYAVNRIPIDWGQLNNMNGDKVADDWEDLWDGTLDNAINRDENNVDRTGWRVWTGSQTDGRAVLIGNSGDPSTWPHCKFWDVAGSSAYQDGRYGTAGQAGSEWINHAFTSCTYDYGSIYCIEN